MKAPLSWIRELVAVPGTPEDIGERMTLRGLALEGIERDGDEVVFDFDVTANRPDCLSIVGIAREMATAYGLPLTAVGAAVRPAHPATAGGASEASAPDEGRDLPVRIDEPELCRRYVAGVADVAVGPTPAGVQARRQVCGIRPINNIVDITNYVLLELGHPMHAFDLARLRGPAIVVRRARPGEELTTLDGRRRALDAGMLVIADAGRACAIGGVMGGADSEVSGHTRSIVFESAWFKPQSIRATSRRLDLRTEASYRFERGADLTAPAAAMARALALLETTGAGRARGAVVDCHPGPYEVRHVALEPAGIGRLLGMAIPEEKARRILLGLGFEIEEGPTAAMPAAPGRDRRPWRVRVPPWRVDVTRAVDLVEEVGRHHGFEHLPATFPRIEEPPAPSDPRIARDARVRRALIAMGFSEAITFAFIEGAAAAPFAGATPPIAIANPLSEKFTTLRPSLLPGLVDAVSHNRRHGRRDVRLFETGTCFTAAGERRSTAVAWTGLATPDHWSGSRREVDLFDVKGVCEQLCASFDVTPEFLATKVAFLVAGRSADVRTAAGRLGVLGLLQPPIAEARELPAADPVFVLELDLDMLTEAAAGGVRFVRSLPRHPAVVRDVSILIDDALSAATVRGTIRAAGGTTADEGGVPTGRAPLVEVREFDRYRGPGIPAGKISLSLRLTFQALDRTLTDAEVQASMDVIVAALSRELGAVQR